MPLEALLLALAAAFLHAAWNVLLRGSADVAARTVAVLCVSVVLFAPAAIATWRVDSAAIPFIIVSAVLEGIYFLLLIAAYRRRELSVVYPVARGAAPAFVLLGTFHATTAQAAGVLLVSLGVMFVRGLRRGAEGIVIGLTIAVFIAAYTLVDKHGLRHAAPIPYLELVLIPPAIIGFLVRPRALREQRSWSTLVAGVGSFGAYLLFLFALRLTAAPGVAAVRETSVVIGAALAAVFLKEQVTWVRFAGAAAVAGGVALLAVA